MAAPTRPLREFLPMTLPFAPGCPEPVAEQMLRMAAIEFCERTRCWRHICTTRMGANGQAIVAPSYATVHEIETAYYDNDIALTPTQFSEVEIEDLVASEADGMPRYITQVSPNTVSIYPFGTGELRLTLFLKPRSGSEFGGYGLDPLQDKYNVVPDHIFVQHGEDIAAGALARILALPGQTYTHEAKAARFAEKFEHAMTVKFRTPVRGQHRARHRVRPVPY